MIGDVLDYYCDENNTNFEGPTVVGFLAKTPADEADVQRELLIKDCEKVNKMMRTIASKYAMDRDFEFIRYWPVRHKPVLTVRSDFRR